MIKNIVSTLVKIGVSIAILYFLFRNMDMQAFWATCTSVNPYIVVLVALFFISTQSVSTLRWSFILKKDANVPYLKLLSIYFIGMFFNNFLPTMVGGDIVKGYYLYKYTKKGDVALASIFMDRYSGFAALMTITAIALIPGYSLIQGTGLPYALITLISAFFVLSLVIWIGPLHSWAMSIMARIHFYGINKKIDTFYKVLMSYKSHSGILWRIFFCSIYVQGGVILGYYILGSAIGMNVPLGYYFLFIPLITTVAMAPISLSGLGLREGAFVFLFTTVGATKEQAITLSLMWFAIAALVSIIGGIEYVRMGGKKAVSEGAAQAQ